MPTYDYACEACGHTFEEFQMMSEDPLKVCPECSAPKLKRLIGGGTGFIFKGSGYYVTDYRDGSYESDKKAESSSDNPAPG